jgi:PAS domain S-box-containing protein
LHKHLTGNERRFNPNELIVTKTDRIGFITYANPVFLSLSQLTDREARGAPHNIIRHPAMPKCIFKLFWERIQGGREIFAYVVNRATNGDHYWVFAHVTPTFDADGTVTGYHSNRRVPNRAVVAQIIEPLYQELLADEACHQDRNVAITASFGRLNSVLASKGMDYDRFIFSLEA